MIKKRDQTERERQEMMELDFEHWHRVLREIGHIPYSLVRKK
jgi:hypothetical protein